MTDDTDSIAGMIDDITLVKLVLYSSYFLTTNSYQHKILNNKNVYSLLKLPVVVQIEVKLN